MRKLTLLLVVLVAAGSFSAFRPSTTTTAEDLAGVWKMVRATSPAGESVDVTWPTIMIYSEGYYAAVLSIGERDLLPDEPTDAQRLAAFDAFDAVAGTYQVQGDRLHARVIVAQNPNDVMAAEEIDAGTSFNIDGDTLTITLGNGLVVTYTRLE